MEKAWASGEEVNFAWGWPGFKSCSDNRQDLSMVVMNSTPPHFVDGQVVAPVSWGF